MTEYMTTQLIVEEQKVEWLPLTTFAEQYGRHPNSIRQWCRSGFMIELGFYVRKDVTGHWIVGVPSEIRNVLSPL